MAPILSRGPHSRKALQERFVALTSSLQGRLDAEYARNVEQKQGLIERARQLVASEDSRKASTR